MGEITIETRIRAPIELCFDLARDVTAHAESAAFSSERVIAPERTQGLLELGDTVAFEGRHFGITQRFVARITILDAPIGSSMRWSTARSSGSVMCTNSNRRTD